ncbi:unnamed protein product, partial [Polarella glacialis]
VQWWKKTHPEASPGGQPQAAPIPTTSFQSQPAEASPVAVAAPPPAASAEPRSVNPAQAVSRSALVAAAGGESFDRETRPVAVSTLSAAAAGVDLEEDSDSSSTASAASDLEEDAVYGKDLVGFGTASAPVEAGCEVLDDGYASVDDYM